MTSNSMTFPASGWLPSTITESGIDFTTRTRRRRPDVASTAVSRLPTRNVDVLGKSLPRNLAG